MKSKTILIIILGLAALMALYAFNPVFHPVDAADTIAQNQPTDTKSSAIQSTPATNKPGTPIATGTLIPGPVGTLPSTSGGTITPQASGTITSTNLITSTATLTVTGTISATRQASLTKTAAATQITGTPTITSTLQITPTIASTPLPPIWGNIKPRETLRSYLPRVLQAIVILIIGWIVAIIARRIVDKALYAINPEVRFFLGKLTFAGVMVAAVLWALSVLQVYFATLATILGTVGLAVSLASQDLIKNLVAGVYLLLEHPFAVGDELTIGTYTGRVMIIDLRTTLLHTDDNQDVLVPNTLIMSQVVVKQLEVVESPSDDQSDTVQSNSENPPDEGSSTADSGDPSQQENGNSSENENGGNDAGNSQQNDGTTSSGTNPQNQG